MGDTYDARDHAFMQGRDLGDEHVDKRGGCAMCPRSGICYCCNTLNVALPERWQNEKNLADALTLAETDAKQLRAENERLRAEVDAFLRDAIEARDRERIALQRVEQLSEAHEQKADLLDSERRIATKLRDERTALEGTVQWLTTKLDAQYDASATNSRLRDLNADLMAKLSKARAAVSHWIDVANNDRQRVLRLESSLHDARALAERRQLELDAAKAEPKTFIVGPEVDLWGV